MTKKLLLAIDGPAASGKGTLAKRLADHFGLNYLDTGSIYRAVGYKIKKDGKNPEDSSVAIEYAKQFKHGDLNNPNLYDEGVGSAASIISAVPEVRTILMKFQKDFAKSSEGAVLDGRDIGTVICPDADFKLYVTAEIGTRAKRRYKQLLNNGKSVIYDDVLQDLQRRDERDSKRKAAPLRVADDAIHIDTTDMNADDVFKAALLTLSKAGLSF